jgi:histidinol-phosphate aminotransferase
LTTKTREAVSHLPGYIMAEQNIPGVERIIQLGQNELALSPSPNAIEAIRQTATALSRYPDIAHVKLRQAIADVHDLNFDQVACGAGSLELLGLLANIYCETGVDVVVNQFGYKFFQVQCTVAGANIIIVPEPDLKADIDGIIDAVTAQTRIVFIVTPNNPTGASLVAGELKQLREKLSDDILLVVDGAYAEFTDSAEYESGFDLVDSGVNLAVTRTFSKAYGLAGLRVGWLYGPADVVEAIAKVRSPNSITTQALAAAEAAMRDQAHLAKVTSEIIELRESFREKTQSLGLQAMPSEGNFVLVRFDNDDQAKAIYDGLLEVGIIVRPMGSYDLHDCLRVTVGTREEMGILQARMVELMA